MALPPGAGAQARAGSDFQVNTHTLFGQKRPSVAVSADGDFVVVWASSYHDGSGDGVFARLFSSAGVPLTSELQVNSFTTGAQNFPSVAVDGDGDFVVAWESNPQDGSDGGVFARRFSSAGAPETDELQVNTYTAGFQAGAIVAALASGDFVVAWQSSGQDNPPFLSPGVFVRLFSSAGVALAGELQVNTYTPGTQGYASLAASASGTFVVAWQSQLQDGSVGGVFARRFSIDGSPLANEFQVNTYTTNLQGDPSVAIGADGDFVIAWSSYYQDASNNGIFVRRFSSSGNALGGELQVNVYTFSDQYRSSVSKDADGGFVVVWSDFFNRDGSNTGVFARRFSSQGAPLTSDFQVNTYTSGHQRYPSVEADGGGGFVVAWQSFGQDGSQDGVFAQRFTLSSALDIDGNGSTQALIDGLLVLRRFFGLTGATLTASGVAGGCVRCDAAAIEPYIAGLGLILDIDGNSTTAALSDGLLALRYLLGFSGDALTNGAVGAGCTRCDAPAIEPYLAGLI